MGTVDTTGSSVEPRDDQRSQRPGRRSPRTVWHEASPGGRFWGAVSALLLLGLAVRVGYVLYTYNYFARNDASSYDFLAKTLAQGHGWGYGTSAYRPPGYVFFLAGVYDVVGIPHRVWTDPRLVQAVLATVTVLLVGLMALQLAGRAAMLITIAISAFYLPFVLVGVALMTEALFVPLVLAAINCALRARAVEHRYRWVVAAGFFCGLASLTRGNGLALGPALAFVVWTGRPWRSRRALAAPLTLLLVMVLTISPWTIRNAIALHAFVPVTTEAGATLAGTYNDSAAKHNMRWMIQYPNYRSIKMDKRLNEAQRDTALVSAVIGYIGRHPSVLPRTMFWNTVRLFDLEGLWISQMTARADADASRGWADLSVFNFWTVGVIAILGIFTRAARRIPRVVWLIPFLLWLSVAPVTTGTPRFRAALDPFVILLAALAIEIVGARWRARRRSRESPARAAVAATNP